MRRARVQHDHHAPAHPPFRTRAGDRVRVDGDTDDVSFVHVSTTNGKGRIPVRYLSAARPDATVLFSYDTTELPVVAGEVVTVIIDDPASRQSWCQDRSGAAGWVPYDAFGVT
ncbi:SH3 domain-containing protein [Microbacterium alcoholitolerans]|uniref:SH3 domain-containing protein n=1 Tax=unclassified Microbacterium TaxID=2609290 RepID=UPI003D175DB0